MYGFIKCLLSFLSFCFLLKLYLSGLKLMNWCKFLGPFKTVVDELPMRTCLLKRKSYLTNSLARGKNCRSKQSMTYVYVFFFHLTGTDSTLFAKYILYYSLESPFWCILLLNCKVVSFNYNWNGFKHIPVIVYVCILWKKKCKKCCC